MLNGVRSHIYSFGHRNPQGLAFFGNRLFESEHGESIDDEVNIVAGGGNYGWPLIAGYQDDQRTSTPTGRHRRRSRAPRCRSVCSILAVVPRQRESAVHLTNFVPPVKTFYTVPNSYDLRTLGNATVAPAGIEVYTSPAIPGWRNSLLMTAMISGAVFRMPLSEDPRHPVGAPVVYSRR